MRAESQTKDAERRRPRSLVVPIAMIAVFWGIAALIWGTTGVLFYLVNFGYIGLALGAGVSRSSSWAGICWGSSVSSPGRTRSSRVSSTSCLPASLPRPSCTTPLPS